MIKLFAVFFLLTAVAATAQIKTETVEYKDGDTVLKGFIAYNSKIKSKAPAVMIVHEWWGLNDYPKMRAKQLAEMGYFAFAVDMYGEGKVVTTPQEAGKLAGEVRSDIPKLRKRIVSALDFIKKDKRVDPNRVAVIGYCFGGGVALELARTGADIKGAICFHGGVNTPHPEETKDVKAKILVCLGADDKYETPADVKSFEDEMNRLNVDWQLNYYSGAVHAFTNPNAGNNPASGVAYNARADKRSFEEMKMFLKEIFETK